jgi:hypothetical protein
MTGKDVRSDAPLAHRSNRKKTTERWHIEARTELEAIDEAAKLFRIAPAVRDKLIATKVSDK